MSNVDDFTSLLRNPFRIPQPKRRYLQITFSKDSIFHEKQLCEFIYCNKINKSCRYIQHSVINLKNQFHVLKERCKKETQFKAKFK